MGSHPAQLETEANSNPHTSSGSNELGFVWDAIGESWEEMFGRLVAYKQQHGDCLVPQRYSDKQLAILGWRSTHGQKQRQTRPRTQPAARRIGICLGPIRSIVGRNVWQVGRLQAGTRRCLVPINYSDKQLAHWVNNQRRSRKEQTRIRTNPATRRAGFIWDPIDEYWEEKFNGLVAYTRQHGDCLVPETTPISN